MIIHGGQTFRNRTFTNVEGKVMDIYNLCEQMFEIDEDGNKPYYLRTCGEEILNDLWFYQIK
jgi:hypothetical protein